MPGHESQSARDKLNWRPYRSKHRERSHHEAHEAADVAQLTPVLDHPLVYAGDPDVITTQDRLHALIDQLAAAGSFAYDSEFIGENTYYPKLCVIQVATTDGIALIDPMTGLDLHPFWRLLADSAVEKIVHAGVQDLEPVMRHVNQPPRNIFDTQIAAAFLEMHYPIGMSKLAQAVIGADPHRGMKFSQWDRRPLSAVQLRYAADDVRYLPLLRRELGERLAANGNAAWAAEECATLSDPALYQFEPASQRLRIRGVETLSRRKTAVLRALVAWREELALRHDVPPRALIKDGVLFELARCPVQSVADLDRVRGLPRPIEKAYGEQIVAMTQRALNDPHPPPVPRRRRHRLDWDALTDRVEAVWSAVQARCAERSIHPAIVTSKKELAKWLEAKLTNQSADHLRVMRSWRRELLHNVLEQSL